MLDLTTVSLSYPVFFPEPTKNKKYILYFIVIDFSQTKCSGCSFSPVFRYCAKLNESLENPVSYLKHRHDINSCVPNHILPLVIFIALRLF